MNTVFEDLLDGAGALIDHAPNIGGPWALDYDTAYGDASKGIKLDGSGNAILDSAVVAVPEYIARFPQRPVSGAAFEMEIDAKGANIAHGGNIGQLVLYIDDWPSRAFINFTLFVIAQGSPGPGIPILPSGVSTFYMCSGPDNVQFMPPGGNGTSIPANTVVTLKIRVESDGKTVSFYRDNVRVDGTTVAAPFAFSATARWGVRWVDGFKDRFTLSRVRLQSDPAPVFWTEFVKSRETASAVGTTLEAAPAPALIVPEREPLYLPAPMSAQPYEAPAPRTGSVYCNAVGAANCYAAAMNGVMVSGGDIGVYMEYTYNAGYINPYCFSNTVFTPNSDANTAQGMWRNNDATGPYPGGPTAGMRYIGARVSPSAVGLNSGIATGYKAGGTVINLNGALGSFTPPGAGPVLFRFQSGGASIVPPYNCVQAMTPQTDPRSEPFVGDAAGGMICGWAWQISAMTVTKFKVYDWGADGTPPPDEILPDVDVVFDSFTGSVVDISSHVGEVGATWTREYTFSDVNWQLNGSGALRRKDFAGNGADSFIHPSGIPTTSKYYVEAGININALTNLFSLLLLARGHTHDNGFAQTVQDGIQAELAFTGSDSTDLSVYSRWGGGVVWLDSMPDLTLGSHVLKLAVDGMAFEAFWDGISVGAGTIAIPIAGSFTQPGYAGLGLLATNLATINDVTINYFRVGYAAAPVAPPIFWADFVKTKETP